MMATSFLRRHLALLPAMLMAGCASSPAVTYYTLTPLPQQQSGLVSPGPGSRLEILPVRLPDEVDRPQLVLRTSPVTVSRREQWRWSGPLSEDIARTLAVSLESRLPDTAVSTGPAAAATTSRYRLQLDVRQLQSSLQSPAGVYWDLHWRLLGSDQRELVSCHARLSEALPEASGVALVQAHQRVLTRLAGQMQPVLAGWMGAGQGVTGDRARGPACPSE